MNTSRGVLSTRAIKYRIEPNTTPCIRTGTQTATPESETPKNISLMVTWYYCGCYCGEMTSDCTRPWDITLFTTTANFPASARSFTTNRPDGCQLAGVSTSSESLSSVRCNANSLTDSRQCIKNNATICATIGITCAVYNDLLRSTSSQSNYLSHSYSI